VARRIYDEPSRFLSARLVDPIDDLTLVIGLPEDQREAVPFRRAAAKLFDIGERRATVNMRLARAE
jgi:hypothetical protein